MLYFKKFDFALNPLKDNIFSKFLPVVISDQVFDYWDKDWYNQHLNQF
ncbi:hypothetical protein SHM_10090 [Spiroplasma ixodetis]|uniref:Spiroplasmavirus-related protein n=1 Tax=Spiroplasma ixodetis TaxID=2141 RepID=A0ABM8BU39_9MOLU|nr:hypothetical protein SHM_10090 [Spiroplasma ixodetis]